MIREQPNIPGFEILEKLGEGGSARVYLARQSSLDRLVAIKCLHPDRVDEDALSRLSLEATTLARISYPGIVAIHDVITDDSGVFMVMEYLSGGTLRERLGQPISLGQALEITIHVARALAYAHDQGIVHRDLKPGNILFREDGRPVITDFGIVYHLDTHQSQRLTQTGTFLGTPAYISPEQINGEPGSYQSDLYALGIVMQEMLTGDVPFLGDTTQSVIFGHLSQQPPQLPAHLSPLQPILDRLLAKLPEQRFACAHDLLDELKRTLEANTTLLSKAARQPELSVPEQLQTLGLSTSARVPTQVLPSSTPFSRLTFKPMVAVVALAVIVIGGLSIHLYTGGLLDRATDEPMPEAIADEVVARSARTLAVLPFTDMSADRDQGYLADGLAEELLNLLAGTDGLQVTARTSSFTFRGHEVPVQEIGQTLGVAHVLQGSVRKSGQRLRVSAQLIDTTTGFHLWSEAYDRILEDVFDIQEEIAESIARALQVKLNASVVGTDNLEAYDLYLQSSSLIDSRDPDKLLRARDLLDRALSLDADYAPALAASGELWLHLSDSPSAYGDIPAAQAEAAARRDLDKALSLNPELAEAHAALGLLAIVSGERGEAGPHLTRALELNPSLGGASNWRAGMLQASGMASEALQVRRRFAEIDPLFPVNRSNLAIAQRLAGQYAAAEQTASRLQSEFPDNHLGWMAGMVVLTDQGRLAEAVAASQRALELDPGRFLNQLYSERLYYKLGEYAQSLDLTVGYYEGRALVGSGRAEQALEIAQSRLEQSPGNIAAVIGQMETLALTGHYQALLDLVESGWGGAANLESLMPKTSMIGDALAPLAIAQRGLGLEDELAETLTIWESSLEAMERHGNGSTPYYFARARFHALSGQRGPALAGLDKAIDMGYRNPLLASAPAFSAWHEEPEYVGLVERMNDHINAERARLELPPI